MIKRSLRINGVAREVIAAADQSLANVLRPAKSVAARPSADAAM